MQPVNPARALPKGLSWYGRRVLAALAALALAATMALVAPPAGDTSAAPGDDATVVAGGSWSGARNLLRYAPGPGFDALGGSWS